MNVLILGAGGREHAIAWKLKQDAPDLELIAAPFRMQPGLQRLAPGARHLTALPAGSGLFEEKRRVRVAKRVAWTEQARIDVRGIERQTAWQILKTLARYVKTGEGDTKQLHDVDPPLLRLRAQNHRIFFRDKGELLEILRVLDRKDAYR